MASGLKRLVILPYILLMIAALLVAWSLYLLGSRPFLRELVFRITEDTATSVTQDVTSYLALPRAVARSNAAHFAASPPLLREDRWATQRVFLEQLRQNPTLAILAVGLADGEYGEAQRLDSGELRFARAGAETASALEFYRFDNAGEAFMVETIPGYDPRTRPWYGEARTRGTPVWSAVYSLYSDAQPAISAAVPFDAPGTGGVTTAVVVLGGLTTYLESILKQEQGSVIILDSAGTVVASSTGHASLALRDHPDPVFRRLEEVPRTPGDTERFAFTLEGERFTGTARRLDEDLYPAWTVAVLLRERAFMAPLVRADRQAVAVMIVSVLLAVALGFIVVRTIITPVRALQRAVVQIDPSDPADTEELTGLVDTRNEIGRLAASFLALTHRIQEDNARLRSGLEEKETLLREVHHRVKNNLQIVSSIVSLETDGTGNPADRDRLLRCQDRIHAMAYVHENAYLSGQISEIDMPSYLERITGAMVMHPVGSGPTVTVSVRCDVPILPLQTAIPCGLIVNELVTNSLRHAFPHNRPNGHVHVSLDQDGEYLHLVVQDSGEGSPEVEGREREGDTGSLLVQALCSQLQGEILHESSDGHCVSIRFPAR